MHRQAQHVDELPIDATGRQGTGPWQAITRGFAAVERTLALWHFRARSRRELAGLEDWIMADAGLDPVEVRKEANKPFWRA